MAEDMESGHIAVIGMAGRFPGAETLERFWENLVSGADVRTTFTDEELAGHIPERLLSKEDYVKKGSVRRGVFRLHAEGGREHRSPAAPLSGMRVGGA